LEENIEYNGILRLLIAFHPKALIFVLDTTAGLLAFHIAGAFPYAPKTFGSIQWRKMASNKMWDYSCGDSSGITLDAHRYSLLIF
jgi:hypothetical protein